MALRELGDDERARLERGTLHPDPAVARRAEIVLRSAAGLTAEAVAEELDVPVATVTTCLARFAEHGMAAVLPAAKSLGASTVAIKLKPAERAALDHLRTSGDTRSARRAGVVLAIGEGKTNREVADASGMTLSAVAKLRREFLVGRMRVFEPGKPAPAFVATVRHRERWDRASALVQSDLELLRELAGTSVAASHVTEVAASLGAAHRARLASEARVLPLTRDGDLDVEGTRALLLAYEAGELLDDEEHFPEPNVELVVLVDKALEARRAPAASAALRPYSTRDAYNRGERIEHPRFGVGVVTSTAETTVEIRFGSETRTLAHRRRS